MRAVHLAEILAAEEAPMTPHGGFPEAAREALADSQLRANLRNATHTIRDKRAAAVAEVPDWEELREAGKQIKERATRHLDTHLEALEAAVTEAGGQVHWAADADEPRTASSATWSRPPAQTEVVKVKSMATDEIGLNDALAARGIEALETDLAELIIQLAGDTSSHILVPAIHRNRAEIRELFLRALPDPGSSTRRRARSPRRRAATCASASCAPRSAVSGANFAVAETGTICVVESEGNGRMCTTLPKTLITVMGIEKVIPRLADLEVMLQLLPRSSTGERMNPYTSLWTGVTPGDGPQEFHLVLLDNGRTNVLADEVGRAGAPLHPLLGLPQRLPGLRAHRRPRLRLGLPGADRRDPHAAAVRTSRRGRRCPGPPRSAAPATTSARSRSTSRPCSSTCAARSSGARPGETPTTAASGSR